MQKRFIQASHAKSNPLWTLKITQPFMVGNRRQATTSLSKWWSRPSNPNDIFPHRLEQWIYIIEGFAPYSITNLPVVFICIVSCVGEVRMCKTVSTQLSRCVFIWSFTINHSPFANSWDCLLLWFLRPRLFNLTYTARLAGTRAQYVRLLLTQIWRTSWR